jgi:hypothetical protein
MVDNGVFEDSNLGLAIIENRVHNGRLLGMKVRKSISSRKVRSTYQCGLKQLNMRERQFLCPRLYTEEHAFNS